MQTAFFTMFPLRGANRVFAVRSPRQYPRMADAVEAAIQANSRPTWDTTAGLMTAVECLITGSGRVHHLAPLPWEIVDCRHQDAGPFHHAHYGETLVGPELAGYQFGLRENWHNKRDVYPYGVNIVGKDLRSDQEAVAELVKTASERFRKMVIQYNQAQESQKGEAVYYLPIGLAITNNAVHIVADARDGIEFAQALKAA